MMRIQIRISVLLILVALSGVGIYYPSQRWRHAELAARRRHADEASRWGWQAQMEDAHIRFVLYHFNHDLSCDVCRHVTRPRAELLAEARRDRDIALKRATYHERLAGAAISTIRNRGEY